MRKIKIQWTITLENVKEKEKFIIMVIHKKFASKNEAAMKCFLYRIKILNGLYIYLVYIEKKTQSTHS